MAGSEQPTRELNQFHVNVSDNSDAGSRMSAKLSSQLLLSGGTLALRAGAPFLKEISRMPDLPVKKNDKAANMAPGMAMGGKDIERDKRGDAIKTPTADEVNAAWAKARRAIDEAVQNRGREANALKTLHDYLSILNCSALDEVSLAASLDEVLSQLGRIKDWDKPQWFKTQPPTIRDASGKLVSEHEFMQQKNGLTKEQMQQWDEWAADCCKPYANSGAGAMGEINALDNYIVRRVALDSIKNWLRRRPCEKFINCMFGALAKNKLYLNNDKMRLRSLKDAEGHVRAIEERDGKLFFEGSEDLVPVLTDEQGQYVELPDDSDMIVFEKRTISGQRIIVPVAQPNGRDPNIQWFSGNAVKRGWHKEERFFKGPDSLTMTELYGFFPDHFPMRLTNSMENRVPTEKVGGAIYGYAREHAGRQARQLIAEFGEVMPGLKRNNSQLINDARQLFGLQKSGSGPAGGQRDGSQAIQPRSGAEQAIS